MGEILILKFILFTLFPAGVFLATLILLGMWIRLSLKSERGMADTIRLNRLISGFRILAGLYLILILLVFIATSTAAGSGTAGEQAILGVPQTYPLVTILDQVPLPVFRGMVWSLIGLAGLAFFVRLGISVWRRFWGRL